MGTLASELRPLAAGIAAVPRVYVDANVPSGLVTVMRRELQWDVLFVLEHDDLRRATDRAHYQRAREFGRTLITLDRDFTDDDKFPLDRSPGVIVLIAPDERGLRRLLVDADRDIFRIADATARPLEGRKLTLTSGAAPALPR
jgi:predicted nuclease of predicted toxin-antitoxin system